MVFRERSWSSAEVRRLVELIAEEQLHTQAILNALPYGVALLNPDLRMTWANQRFIGALGALSATSLEQAVRASLRQEREVVVSVPPTGYNARIRARECTSVMPRIIVVCVESVARQAVQTTYPLESCSMPVAVYEEEGCIRFANAEMCNLSGYDDSRLKTMDIGVLFPKTEAPLNIPGSSTGTLRQSSGSSLQVEISIKRCERDGDSRLFSLTAVELNSGSAREALNVAALEGCIFGAFPDSSITRTILANAEQFSLRMQGQSPKRYVKATREALRSDRFREYLRDLPEALRTTTAVSITHEGITVEETHPSW